MLLFLYIRLQIALDFIIVIAVVVRVVVVVMVVVVVVTAVLYNPIVRSTRTTGTSIRLACQRAEFARNSVECTSV
jgi:hypothetical protein